MLRSSFSSNLKILIIDENKNLTDLLTRLLTYRGYKVTIANTLSKAVQVLKNNKPDIVLFDPTFKEHTKEESMEEFQKNNFLQNHKIIIFSGTCVQKFIEKYKTNGIYSYLEKPVRISDIMGLLEEAVKKRYNSKSGSDINYETLSMRLHNAPPKETKIHSPRLESELTWKSEGQHERSSPDELGNILTDLSSTEKSLKTKIESDDEINSMAKRKEIETEINNLRKNLSEIKNDIYFRLDKKNTGRKYKKRKKEPTSAKIHRKQRHSSRNKNNNRR